MNQEIIVIDTGTLYELIENIVYTRIKDGIGNSTYPEIAVECADEIIQTIKDNKR